MAQSGRSAAGRPRRPFKAGRLQPCRRPRLRAEPSRPQQRAGSRRLAVRLLGNLKKGSHCRLVPSSSWRRVSSAIRSRLVRRKSAWIWHSRPNPRYWRAQPRFDIVPGLHLHHVHHQLAQLGSHIGGPARCTSPAVPAARWTISKPLSAAARSHLGLQWCTSCASTAPPRTARGGGRPAGARLVCSSRPSALLHPSPSPPAVPGPVAEAEQLAQLSSVADPLHRLERFEAGDRALAAKLRIPVRQPRSATRHPPVPRGWPCSRWPWPSSTCPQVAEAPSTAHRGCILFNPCRGKADNGSLERFIGRA